MKKLLAVLMALCMLFQAVGMVALAEEAPVEAAPAEQAPVAEEPAAEAPVVEEPAAEAPVVEEPVVETPVVEEPVVETPVVEEPVVEIPVVEEPVVEAPVVEEPVVEAPVVEEPVVETPVVEEPVVETPVVEEPVAEEPVVEEPVVEEPTEEIPELKKGYAVITKKADVTKTEGSSKAIYVLAKDALVMAEEIAESDKVQVKFVFEGETVKGFVKANAVSFLEGDVDAKYAGLAVGNLYEMKDYAEAVVEETVEEPAEEVAEEVIEKTGEEVTEEVAEEVTEEVAEEVAGEVAEEVTEEVTEEAAEEATGETAEEVTDAEEKAAPDYYKYFTFDGSGKITEVNNDIYKNQTDLIIPATYKDASDVVHSVTGIMASAFARNTQITGITINSDVAYYYVAPGAFEGCTSLKFVSMPNASSTDTIEKETFKGCTALTSISWSQYIKNIGLSAFEGCTALTTVSFPLSVENIGDYAFKNCTNLKQLNMQNGLKTLGTGAFYGCKAMEKIAIPDTVTSIGSSAFENCTAATEISFPANAAFKEINPFTFQGCTALTTVTIPNTVSIIGRMSFRNCSALNMVDIPASVTAIGEEAFNNILNGAWIFVDTKTATLGNNALGTQSVIFGWNGSTAQKYCASHTGCTFVPMDVFAFIKRHYEYLWGTSLVPNRLTIGADALAMVQGNLTGAQLASNLVKSPNYTNRKLNYAQFVEAIYQAMLGRSADTNGLNTWTEKMTNGVSEHYVINALGGSGEYVGKCAAAGVTPGFPIVLTENRDQNYELTSFVARCYTILLGRSFDVGGLNNWTGLILTGKGTGTSMVLGFINSAEFQNQYPSVITPEIAVERLYQTMLNRGSDPTGKTHWVTKLKDGMSLDAIVCGFSGSWEWRGIVCPKYGINPGTQTGTQPRDKNQLITQFVYRCYLKALDRSPDSILRDAAGLNNWTNVLLSGKQTPNQVAKGFVFSEESLYRNLNDTQFITMLYGLYMNRTPDAGGMTTWTSYLANGGTRVGLCDNFAGSVEFQKILATYGLK